MPRPNKLGDEDDDDHRRSLPPPRHSDSNDHQASRHPQKRHVEEDEHKCSPPDRLRSSTVASKSDTDELVAATLQPSSALKLSPVAVDAHQGKRNAKAFGAKETHSTAVCAPTVPGAVREGLNQAGSSSPANSGSLDGSRHSDSPIVAEVVTTVDAQVVRADDLELQVEDLFRQRVDDIAQQVTQKLQKNAGDDVTTSSSSTDNDAALQKRKRCIRLFGACIVAAMVIAAVVVVSVLMTRPSPKPKPTPESLSKSTLSPVSLPPTPSPVSLPPTPSPMSLPPTPSPTAVNKCADFPCNSTLSVLELVSSGSNHTLLWNFLNRAYNLDLVEYLSSDLKPITLFAPTDESFQDLKFPFSLYLTYNSFWRQHLWVLLVNHILDSPQNTTQIFQEAELSTVRRSYFLSVNRSTSTIENGASIATADIQATNGYIQIPDRVIIDDNLDMSLLEKLTREDFIYILRASKFIELLKASGLEDTLTQVLEDGLTVFVPTNEAFDLLDANVTDLLFDSVDESFIKNLILYHIINFNVFPRKPQSETAFVMFNNVSAWFTNNNPYNDSVLNSATWIATSTARNGFLTLVDRVLVPPSLGELLQITSNVTTEFDVTRFTEIVSDYAHLGGLLDGVVEGHPYLGNFYTSNDYLTVFAPVNSAFVELADQSLMERLMDPSWLLHLQNLCLHHFTLDITFGSSQRLVMLSGFELELEVLAVATVEDYVNETIDGVTVEVIYGTASSRLLATTGVIHFIKTVLLPPWMEQSLIDKLSLLQDASSFALLLQKSNFTDLLNSTDSPLTVLAPNNAAIKKLGNMTSYSIHKLLSRHILQGNVYNEPFLNKTVMSLANVTFHMQTLGNKTYIGGGLIVQPNNLASNGVIHIVDRVL